MPEPVETTTARIQARKTAEEVFSLACGEADSLHEDFRRSFWTLLAYRIAEHTGTINDYQPKTVQPSKPTMTDAMVLGFERGQIPFKTSHSGKLLKDVPLGFLHWLLEKHQTESRWFTSLEAYLNSRRVSAEEQEPTDYEEHENA